MPQKPGLPHVGKSPIFAVPQPPYTENGENFILGKF